uniref:Prolyl 4-hydroxylase alpha subunit domain-containing protein n=1 Tax=Meloidogyne enterolobii TaxID=390850 RepID=A0A6V7WID1_MELEN|nr:unnamed protein product [Meloidogyne enterolobii]
MYLLINLLFILIKLINSQDLFTSSAELQQLVHVEKEIPKIIENYILLENKRLENLKSIANKYLKEESELFELEPKSVLNPLIALRVIKKLTKTWKEIKKEIQSDLAENYLKNISNQRETRFPNEADLNGAIQGLLRLHDTYKLKTKDLANGIVEDININKQMDAKDCYEIGLAAYNEEDYYHSILWMEEANERYYLLEKEFREINKSDILNILSVSLYKQGNLKRALIINDKLIELDPLYPNATNNSKLYEQELLANGVNEEDFRSNIPPLNNYRPLNDTYYESVDRLAYEELCREENEIILLRGLQCAWINIKTHPIIKQIVKRLSLMTNLNTKWAEPLQVANYGIGGYCGPHFDSFKSNKDSNLTMEIGDRIATVLFYSTTPEKACPVLLGDKWVSNCWIREGGQEFVRPCGLDPSIQERYVGDLGGPEPKKYPNISPYCKGVYCE